MHFRKFWGKCPTFHLLLPFLLDHPSPSASSNESDWKIFPGISSIFISGASSIDGHSHYPGEAHLLTQPGTDSQKLLYQCPANVIPKTPPGTVLARPPTRSTPRKRPRQSHQDDSRPHIKKPPNASMVYLEEQRPKVVDELNISGSADVNAVVGARGKKRKRIRNRSCTTVSASDQEDQQVKKPYITPAQQPETQPGVTNPKQSPSFSLTCGQCLTTFPSWHRVI
ncbi:small subunit ribosomal protein S17e [Sarotherodon galilaeus]